ncbi:MAG: non-homologous end-joining DNA ligase [Planctomycetes bacterium]|nr:non-homologous end-joining DNA ligase [Planctomycetota bacterium]
MADPLDDYRKKRDFDATPEPTGGPADAAAPRAPVFVVHRHEARNLHYDLRLETGGVLRSWAVPKGFSYDPGDKRLAVQTEDHPLEYEHFHGRIPRGQYGAGTMQIWDRGRYDLVKVPDWPTAMQLGEVKIVLRGRRLRGEWHLVKTTQGKNTWLLFKSKDRYAGTSRDSALGVELGHAPESPFLAAPGQQRIGGTAGPFVDPGWLFEMEFIGQRALLQKRGDAIDVRGVPLPPAVAHGALRLRAESAVLDGVLVALDAAQRPCRESLARALAGDGHGVVFYAFDLLFWEDYDLRPLPLLDRKAALRAIVAPNPGVLYVDHVTGSGPQLLDVIAQAGLPAAVGKRATGAFVDGPSADWLRIPVGSNPAAAPRAAPTATRPPTARSRVRLTNLDKVWWPAEGYTKGDLLAYYDQIADVLLPHLRDRPVHLNRFPDGIDGKSFYQREAKDGTPDWVRTTPVPHDGGVTPHHVIDTREQLLYAINLGSIDLHPWLSRAATPDAPDFALLDLDPKEAPWPHVVRIARAAGKLLRGIGLRPLLKTSGKKGIHIVIPLQPGYSYDHSKMFTEAVARVLVRQLPSIATVERLPDARDGKVYLDFLQNRRSQTIVPPYSARPVRGAQVSAPLAWDELEDDDLHPSRFSIFNMPGRVSERGDLLRPLLEDRQDLLPAIEALQQVLREG